MKRRARIVIRLRDAAYLRRLAAAAWVDEMSCFILPITTSSGRSEG